MSESSQHELGRSIGLPFLYRDHRTYQWWFDDHCWSLTTADRCVVARVVPDTAHAGMWRIDFGDRVLSDMVNLSRAKDAAIKMADARLATGKRAPVTSPMRETDAAGTEAA